MESIIEPMHELDWPEVRRIYQEGIATGNATFATTAPEWEAWDKGHLAHCRLVARGRDRILGWAALSAVSSRCVYSGVAEVSVYVSTDRRGKGVGKALLAALVEASECAGIWMLQAGVFPENAPSIATHRACGFREIGRREKLGKMNDAWRDVLLLERRSKTVGITGGANGQELHYAVASTRTHGSYVLEKSSSRIDWSRVHAWLTGAYGTPGITREQVERAARNSAMVLAAFSEQGQVAYLRVVSDKTRFAYICDVWVDVAHRRHGLAQAMVRYAMEHPDFSTVSWLLATDDAHGVYAPLGFAPLKHPQCWMSYKLN